MGSGSGVKGFPGLVGRRERPTALGVTRIIWISSAEHSRSIAQRSLGEVMTKGKDITKTTFHGVGSLRFALTSLLFGSRADFL
jgi:hypothetical protein